MAFDQYQYNLVDYMKGVQDAYMHYADKFMTARQLQHCENSKMYAIVASVEIPDEFLDYKHGWENFSDGYEMFEEDE